MATIIDVAKLAGVGIGSVSRVINGKDSVSDKTKLKVNKAIKALNYKPNQSARSFQISLPSLVFPPLIKRSAITA